MTQENNSQIKYGKIIYLWLAVCSAALILFDQLMKHQAIVHLKDKPAIVLIKNVLELQYLENHGAAFGILQNKQFIFTIITILFIVISFYVILRIPKTKYYLPLITALVFLFSGAIGNFIDRTVNKYVVDFIYFSIIDFPIFNVADIYVSLSVIAILIMVLFRYKDKDFQFLKLSGNTKNEESDS